MQPDDKTNETIIGEFRLARRLTSTSQVMAVGLAILGGMLFLLPVQVTPSLSRVSPLAAFLGMVLIGLTLLSVVELLGGSGEQGGTYVLVRESLGGPVAFLSGWAVLAGGLALWAATSRAAASLLATLIVLPAPVEGIALALALGLVVIQQFQILPRRPQLRTLSGLILLLVIMILISLLPRLEFQPPAPGPATGLESIARAIVWISPLYLVFEALLSIRRQIRDPGRQLPLAILYTATLGGLLLITMVWGLSRLPVVEAGTGELFQVLDLARVSLLPRWLVQGTALAALALAANGCMMAAARQANTLSREGALPTRIRQAHPPFRMPPVLFSGLAALVTPLILLPTIEWLVGFAAGAFLVVMALLNLAAIQSQRVEPQRRRPFAVPFAPLVPTTTLGLNVILLRYVPPAALLGVVVLAAVGTVYYFAYARSHLVEAQEGEITFGRIRPRQAEKPHARILVPIGPGEERHLLLQMATGLANQLDGEVIPLQVVTVPDPLAIEEGRRTARERNTLFQWSIRAATDVGIAVYPITRLARNIPEGIIDTAIEENCNLILMPWAIRDNRQGPRIGSILHEVAREAPCDVAVLSYHPAQMRARIRQGREEAGSPSDEEQANGRGISLKRILVPTSGGPNAPLAIRLALLWARQYGATVTAVYIARPDASADEIVEGERRIQQSIATMRAQAENLPGRNGHEGPLEELAIEGQVIQAPGVIEGIAQAGAAFDLLLLGATEESVIDQVLFGNIPEEVARRCPTPVIIVKRYQGLPRLWLTRAWDALFQALPTLTDEEQIEVYRAIHRGSRPDVDFFIMIGLSTVIATYGLFQNSSAVIIGAMLVAPLFSPLIALSLSIAQGNIRLFRLAVEANLKGVALAVGLALFLGLITPTTFVTPEIVARTHPSVQDLIVALASGAAGAYAMARKDVATALPGVAIAAALVPPLSVIGIGLAYGDLEIASGSSLLFTTNLVAIVLAGSLVFLLLGFRPGSGAARAVHLRRGLLITILLFLIVAIPLVTVFVQSIRQSQLEITIQSQISRQLETHPGVELVNADLVTIADHDEAVVVTIPLYVQGEIPPSLGADLSQALSQAIDKPVRVRLVTQTLIEATP